MILIGILIGIIVGFILGLIFVFSSKKKKSGEKSAPVEKYIRRGIILRDFSTTDVNGRKDKINVQYEIGELESTDKLSKIEVIVVIPSQSEYLTDFYKKKLTELIDKSWIESSEVNWITTTADTRNRKIDEILN
jgi:hypothetical protein